MIIFIYHQSVNKANNNINPSVKSALYKLFLSLVGIVQSLGSVQIFCNPMDYCLPGSSVHGISQVRILEQVAISFSREIFLTQVLNLHLLHWQADSLLLSHLGNQHYLSIISSRTFLYTILIPLFAKCRSFLLHRCLVHVTCFS